MRILLKSIKFFIILFFIFLLSLLTAYFSHPEYIKNEFIVFFKLDNFNRYNYFKSKSCLSEKNLFLELNNKYYDYIDNSRLNKFDKEITYSNEIKKYVQQNKLVYIKSNEKYIIDTLFYSYSFLVPKAKELLDNISNKFQYYIQNTLYKDRKLHISSLLRTKHSVKRLKRNNFNSIKSSSHLHGTSFDIDYLKYSFNLNLKKYDVLYLKNILATVLLKFKNEKKCFVTFESKQSCFHVVLRNEK